MSKLLFEHIPSRREVYELINGFISEQSNKDIKYTTKDTDSTLIIHFPSTELGINFLKYVNYKKMQNRIFFKMKVKLQLEKSSPNAIWKPKLESIKDIKKLENSKDKDKNNKHVNKDKDKSEEKEKNINYNPSLTDINHKNYLKTKDSIHFLKQNLRNKSLGKSNKSPHMGKHNKNDKSNEKRLKTSSKKIFNL
jgi:hypothetical protein